MSITGTSADEIGDALIIKLASPYTTVSKILSYEDSTTGETTNSYFAKYFRWSINNTTYSDWIYLTDENLRALVLDSTKDFWINYKYEVLQNETGHKLTFNSISLEIVTSKGLIQQSTQVDICNNDCNAISNLVIEECGGDVFKPYDLNAASQNYLQLSCLVSEIFGHKVRYFHLKADERSRDVILKEHSIYRGDDVKEITMMVPDNVLPTREIAFEGMGMDMPDAPFEVHIVKSVFQDAFGAKERPGVQDYLFFPLMDRMYEVNSIALPDDFMYDASYYRVSLVLYQDRTNRDYTKTEEAAAMEIEADDLTTGLEEAFAVEVADEFEKVRKPKQYNTIGTGDKDYIRKELNRNLLIKEYKIKNNFTVVSKYFYKLNIINPGDTAVVYRYTTGIPVSEDRAFTFWYRPQFANPESPAKLITNVENSTDGLVTFEIIAHGYQVNDWVRITGTNDYNGYYKVVGITPDKFMINAIFVSDTSTVPKSRKQEVSNFWNYGTGAEGFSISIMQKLFVIKVNGKDYVYDMSSTFTSINDTWYGVVINYSNQFKQLSLFVYEINSHTGHYSVNDSSLLKTVYSETKVLESVDVPNDLEWSLIGCNIDVTNLRIFKLPIEEEEHSLLLSQYVVADSHLNLMVDNAQPSSLLVRMGNPR